MDRLGIDVYNPMNDELVKQRLFNMRSGSDFRIEDRPTESTQHVLTFKFVKSNGEES